MNNIHEESLFRGTTHDAYFVADQAHGKSLGAEDGLQIPPLQF